MEDFITSLKAHLYDKPRSPFLTAFFFSWASWNVKALAVIFSKGDLNDKIKILNELYPDVVYYVMQWVIYPIFSASIFIFFYPVISLLAFSYWNYLNNLTKRIQVWQDDKAPASQEQINRLRKDYADISISKEKTIYDLVGKRDELTKSLQLITETVSRLELEKAELIRNKESTATQLDEAIVRNKELEDEGLKLKQTLNENLAKAVDKDTKAQKIDEFVVNYLPVTNLEIDEKLREVIEVLAKITQKFSLNSDELYILFSVVKSGTAGLSNLSVSDLFQNDSLKSSALLNSLNKKKLIYASGAKLYLTETTSDYLLESGFFSLPNYRDALAKLGY